MKTAIVSRRSGDIPRLILFFAGWGMDPRPFASLAAEGYDLAVVWDYSDPEPLPASLLASYREICVLAWSFGVPYAARFIASNELRLPVTRCVAVAGTLTPVDDLTGIPRDIFEGTLAGLDERTLDKFRRRMTGGGEAYRTFMASAPERTVGSLGGELLQVAADGASPEADFDAVYLTGRDRIIPYDSQRNAWHGHHNAVLLDNAPHMPDFGKILRREFRDKNRVRRSFESCGATYDEDGFMQKEIAGELARVCRSEMKLDLPVVEFGVGTGLLTRSLGLPPSRMRLYDLAPLSDDVRQADAELDIERMVKSESNGVGAVVSASTIQWFNSPRRFIRRAIQVMNHGAVLALSTFGKDNFKELWPYQSSRPNYMSVDELRSLGLTLENSGLVSGHDWLTMSRISQLEFDSTGRLMEYLRRTGVNATQAPDIAAARLLMKSNLRELSYEPVLFIARRQ